jgi:hypothetical protein
VLHLQYPAVLFSASPYPVLRLQAAAYPPLRLQPQLDWPTEAAVDWETWSATAAVTVVPASEATAYPQAANYCGGGPAGALSDEAFTVKVRRVPIGQVPSRSLAERLATQIRQAIPQLEDNPAELMPSLGPTEAGGELDGQTVFLLPADLDPEALPLVATHWVNHLRLALGARALDATQMHMVAAGLGETAHSFSGTASWYGPYFHGRQTAMGEIFNQHELTAAHKTLPFGTYLKVRNQNNGRTVVVRINDRGPYIGDRSLDLSYAAAQCLGADYVGLIPYHATILEPGLPRAWRREVLAALP